MPSRAVTTVLIMFKPTDKGISHDSVPEATIVPFTVIVAVVSPVLGVMVTAVTELFTVVV